MSIIVAASALAGNDGGQADGYGNTDKTKCYWKHQAVYSKDKDPITYYERESCAHRIAYPYAYCKPPKQ